MLLPYLFPALTLSVSSVLANSCPKPVVSFPPGIISAARPITITGTTTYPCWAVDIYVYNQFHTVAYGSGPQELGANLTISWEDDLLLPQGDLRIAFRATEPFGEYNLEPTFSDPVVVSYGHTGCPEPTVGVWEVLYDAQGSPTGQVAAQGYSFPVFEGGCGGIRAYVDGVEWNDIDLEETQTGRWNFVLNGLSAGDHEVVVTKEEFTGQFNPQAKFSFTI